MTHTPAVPVHMQRNVLDPAPALGEIRESTGIHLMKSLYGETTYVLTRYDDVKDAFADYKRFSNRRPPSFEQLPSLTDGDKPEEGPGSLLAMDPPDHQRLRRMLTPEFTVHRMKRLQPRIIEIVTEHLDAMEQAGPPSDLIADFALPIPSLVICELLGVPYEDRDDFQQRTARQLNFSLPPEERRELMIAARQYMFSLVQRARQDPGDDLLGMLATEHGDDLTDNELVGIAGLLLVAGHETTSNMLGLGAIALLQHPDQLAAVRDDPAAVGPAIEELLRYLSVVQHSLPRLTTTEITINGVIIPAGRLVMLSLPSANRDPKFIDDPDTLDIGRGAMGHMAFGHGIHHCLGAPLARMEMRIAFPALLQRFPRLALAEDPTDMRFREFNLVYGATSLQVTW